MWWRFGDKIMRQLNLFRARAEAKPVLILLTALCFRMRFAPEPVKLRIANVCRPGI
jgi:hypothetical protein